MMDANQYQQAALRTWMPEPPTTPNGRAIDFLYQSAQIASEAGEVAGSVAKWIKYGREVDFGELGNECGDLLWHVVVFLDMIGLDVEEVMRRNIAKLEDRHPSGNPRVWYERQNGVSHGD